MTSHRVYPKIIISVILTLCDIYSAILITLSDKVVVHFVRSEHVYPGKCEDVSHGQNHGGNMDDDRLSERGVQPSEKIMRDQIRFHIYLTFRILPLFVNLVASSSSMPTSRAQRKKNPRRRTSGPYTLNGICRCKY